jgi:hypothetical protein
MGDVAGTLEWGSGLTTGTTPYIALTSTGSVGIGTTSPLTSLHISGSTSSGVDPVVLVQGGSTTDATSGAAIQFMGYITAQTADWYGAQINNVATGVGVDYSQALAFYTNPGSTRTGLTEKMRILANGNVGIGTTTPTGVLSIYSPSSTANVTAYGIYESGALTATDTSGVFYGESISPSLNVSTTVSNLFGSYIIPQNAGTGVATNIYGLDAQPENTSSGTAGSLYGVYAVPTKTGTGPVTSMYGLYGNCSNNNATGAVTNCYELYLDTPGTTGTITNQYGVYQNTSSVINYLAGKVGLGTTAPGYLLDIRNNSGANELHVSGDNADDGAYLMGLTAGAYLSGDVAYNGSQWVAKSTAASIIYAGTAGIQFYTNAGLTATTTYAPTGVMVITTTGSVGIGTVAPGYPLEVFANSSNWAGLFTNAASSSAAYAYFADGAGYGAYIDAGSNASSSTYALDVSKQGSAYLYVRGDGDVVIDGTAPVGNFTVYGGTYITSSLVTNGCLAATAGGGYTCGGYNFYDNGNADIDGALYTGAVEQYYGNYIYPGCNGNSCSSNFQTSYALEADGRYGLYINTGLGVAGGITAGSTVIVGSSDYYGNGDIYMSYSNTYMSTVLGWNGSTYNPTFNSIASATSITASGGGTVIAADNGNIRGGYLVSDNDVYCATCGGWLNGNLGISDVRLKRDIEPVDGGLETIMQLKPVSFYWKKEDRNKTLVTSEDKKARNYGFIAQDVEKVLPDIVNYTGPTPEGVKKQYADEPKKGWLGINYNGFIAPTVKAVQELYGKWSADHNTLAKLQADNDDLRKQLQALQAEVKLLDKAKSAGLDQDSETVKGKGLLKGISWKVPGSKDVSPHADIANAAPAGIANDHLLLMIAGGFGCLTLLGFCAMGGFVFAARREMKKIRKAMKK